jgi:hypothetical protein
VRACSARARSQICASVPNGHSFCLQHRVGTRRQPGAALRTGAIVLLRRCTGRCLSPIGASSPCSARSHHHVDDECISAAARTRRTALRQAMLHARAGPAPRSPGFLGALCGRRRHARAMMVLGPADERRVRSNGRPRRLRRSATGWPDSGHHDRKSSSLHSSEAAERRSVMGGCFLEQRQLHALGHLRSFDKRPRRGGRDRAALTEHRVRPARPFTRNSSPITSFRIAP